jgi:hypothetical protein
MPNNEQVTKGLAYDFGVDQMDWKLKKKKSESLKFLVVLLLLAIEAHALLVC